MYFGGRTVGKRALGIEVLRADGLPVGWRESALRNLLLVADFLPMFYLAAWSACCCRRPGSPAWADFVAGAQVGCSAKPPIRTSASRKAEPCRLPFPLTPEQRARSPICSEREGRLAASRLAELGSIAEALTRQTGAKSLERMRRYAAGSFNEAKQFETSMRACGRNRWILRRASLEMKRLARPFTAGLSRCLALARATRLFAGLDRLSAKRWCWTATSASYGSPWSSQVLRAWLLQDLPSGCARSGVCAGGGAGVLGVGLAVDLLVGGSLYWAYSLSRRRRLSTMQEMYQPGRVGVGRGGSDGDVAMFGLYIWNNVSIGFALSPPVSSAACRPC